MPTGKTRKPVRDLFQALGGVFLRLGPTTKELAAAVRQSTEMAEIGADRWTDLCLRSLIVCFIEQSSISNFEWRVSDSGYLARFLGLTAEELPPNQQELELFARVLLTAAECNKPVTTILKAIREDPRVKTLAAENDLKVGTIVAWGRYLKRQLAQSEIETSGRDTPAVPDAGSAGRSGKSATTPAQVSSGTTRPTFRSLNQIESITVIGTYERGGIIRLGCKGRSAQHSLPRGPWAVLALLVDAANQAQVAEFASVSPAELCRRLNRATRHTGKPLFCDKPALAKYVLRLRESLQKAFGAALRQLIKTEQLGYRLDSSAELSLLIQADDQS